MKTVTLEQAVTDTINAFVAQGKSFSAHEVTASIRKQTNEGKINISGIPYGYVNSAITHGQFIEHSDVRDIVGQVSLNLDLDVNHNGTYKMYSGKTTTTDSILDRVCGIVESHLNIDRSLLTLNANFIDDLGADSLDLVEMVVAVEEEFKDILKAEIPESDAEKLQTIGDVVNYIKGKQVSPTVTAVPTPQRFLVNVRDDLKDHVTAYVRSKLASGVHPTLHQIAKTTRITVKEVSDIVLANGWTLRTPPGGNVNTLSIKEVY